MRVFISIELPEEIKKEIVRIQKELPEFKGKMTEKENLHLTLKFLGEIDDVKLDGVKKKLKEIKIERFKSGLGELGVFNPEFIKIIWIHLLGTEKLQKEIDNKLDFPKEERFMSHLTIARVKNISDKKGFIEKIKSIKVVWKEWQVNSFKLMKSTLTPQGPIYETIEEYGFV